MRLLYLDIDSLRPDHLGCYGYHRPTSPTIDALAADGIRCDNLFVSDAPCLPSRTALTQGRFGISSGVVNHGGLAAELRPLGRERDFDRRPGFGTFFQKLADQGYHTASISPFADRHGAWWFLAGLNEWVNTGKGGNENADEINAVALPWLEKHAQEDNWVLHLNYWDPHTPYRVPESFGNPFEGLPTPAWYSEEIRQQHWDSYGTLSAQDGRGFWFPESLTLERPGIPSQIASQDDYRAWIDGYDTGIRYADAHLQQLLELLDAKGVLDDTLIVVTADHGENQGELNVYGDHQTADLITCRVPGIVRPPASLGLPTGRVDSGLHYHFDLAATLLELLGAEVPAGWDGRSFAPSLRAGDTAGRDELVVSQMAWSCQRSVRWDDWLLMRTYHAGLKAFPEVMLFDAVNDPHETHDLAAERPELVHEGLARLQSWHADQLQRSPTGPIDPLQTVLREGGPFHTRDPRQRAAYLERLRASGRKHHARHLERLVSSG